MELADETFDMVIPGLTWTLPYAGHAYREWLRVLKHGGILLNFDANYGASDCAESSTYRRIMRIISWEMRFAGMRGY